MIPSKLAHRGFSVASSKGACSCRQVRFHGQKIEGPDSDPTIECDGPIAFDDQFARFYVVTEPFPPQRPDLPVPENLPRLTEKEAEFLKGWVRDWDYYHPLQQAAVICVLRGEKTYEKIAETLSVKDADIRSALRGMSSVISRDCSTGKLGLW